MRLLLLLPIIAVVLFCLLLLIFWTALVDGLSALAGGFS